MERLVIQQLVKWKKKTNRKPLIIQGARQVGKTWIMKEFGNRYFKKQAYINFENSNRLQHIFETDFNISRIISIFEIETGQRIDKNTLIILDEIQEAKKGLTALKYFCENAPNYFIIAAGSFLGVSIQNNHSFPVGKVEFITLHPLNFEEFLLNKKEELLLKYLKEKNWKILAPFHDKLIELLRTYYFVGGMPEVVQSFLLHNDFKKVRTIQKNILFGYENDFAKHATADIVPRIRMVWSSLVAQLSKENKKFIFGLIKKGARAKEFENAIAWLEHTGLIYKSSLVSKPGIPLTAYADFNSFKLYLLDIGLLQAMAEVDEKLLLEKNKILTEYKGSMTEQFVAQELIIKNKLYYWTKQQATSEIDFLLQQKNAVIPIEVKAEENLKAKSLKVFVEKFKPSIALRTSMNFYRKEDWLSNIPLYAIGFM